MTANGWLQIMVFLALILAVTKPMGVFMTRVFNRERTFMDPVLRPIERLLYRMTGVDENHEMRWTEYAFAMLLFSVVSMLLLYLMQRVQGFLPFNPQKFGAVNPPHLAFNTAASFTTNTNWQDYSGETTMSYFTQMAGLAYHNFISAAIGIALAIAFIRGIARRQMQTIGNFWVDMVRTCLWVLLPFCIVGALLLVSQGVVQNLRPYDSVKLVEPQQVQHVGADGKPAVDATGKPVMDTVTTQTIAQGPVASQEIIKEWGTNGGGFFNANSAHPFENPTPLSNLIELFCIFAISAGLTYTLGRMTGSQSHGWAVWAAMAVLFLVGVTVAYWAEARGNPLLAGADQHVTALQPGGNMEGKEVRFGITNSASVCNRDHGRQLRRHQRLARFVHAARRHGAAGQHHAERSHLRRRGRWDVRHFDLHRAGGIHRRTDGGPHAGISRQEDRSLRREDGHAGRAGLPAGNPGVHGDFIGERFRHLQHHQSRAARLHADAVLHLRQGAGNNGSAFGGLNANTLWYNITDRVHHVDRPVPDDHPHAGHCRQPGGQEVCSAFARDLSRDHAAFQRAADRRDSHRGRVDILPGAEPGTDP